MSDFIKEAYDEFIQMVERANKAEEKNDEIIPF